MRAVLLLKVFVSDVWLMQLQKSVLTCCNRSGSFLAGIHVVCALRTSDFTLDFKIEFTLSRCINCVWRNS